jgi:predicted negative regulator of RcsB-dependent stress response
MNEDLIEARYDITKKSKLRRFYETNKILIFSSIFVLAIILISFSVYFENKEKNKILLSENYVQAKIYLENGNKDEAISLLKKVIFANDPTYSTLSFFIILNQNLVTDHEKLSTLFDHLLNNNKFEKEVINLLIYKKALFNSNFISESKLLNDIQPLLNTETLWKPHALLLMGDYFVAKKEYIKAKEFYTQILLINNLQKDFYDQARSKLIFITND